MTLAGQTMASTTTSCAHSSATADLSMMTHHHNSVSSTDDGHKHGELMIESDEEASIMDCCQEQCQCPMNGCFSLSMLLTSTFNSPITGEQKITHLPSLSLPQVNSSLYRPPIS